MSIRDFCRRTARFRTEGTPIEPNPGLRQRKKDDLRSKLIETAIELFIARGYAETTVDDIVAGLNVSTRTFFRYFDSKEEVVVAGPFSPGTRLREFSAAAPPDFTALEAARYAVRRLAEFRQSLPDGLRHAVLMVETPELAGRLAREREIWSRGLAAELQSRLTGDEVALRASLIAGCTIATVATAFDQWVAERGARPLTTILDVAFAFVDEAHADPDGVRDVA